MREPQYWANGVWVKHGIESTIELRSDAPKLPDVREAPEGAIESAADPPAKPAKPPEDAPVVDLASSCTMTTKEVCCATTSGAECRSLGM